MQDIFNIIIIALAQGFLEFLPVSSSAHLLILKNVFNIKNFSELKFFAECATFLVVLFYFYSIILGQIIGVFKKQKASVYFFLKVLLSTLPIAFAFPFLNNKFSNISFFLIAGSILMLIAERKQKDSTSTIFDVTFKQAFIIGIFQIFSIFSGFSRSGSTICGGLLCGLCKKVAIKYSFLISLPLTFCSLVYDFSKLKITNINQDLITFFACFCIGFFAIKICFAFLQKYKLFYFAIYRILLAIFILFL